jgi:ribonuclease-3
MAGLPHEFSDPRLLELALTHASAHGGHDNERLEFLGDAALDLVVAEELFRAHDDLAEGQLTELKASVVARKVLAQAATRLDLGSRAHVGPGMRGRALPVSVLANLYEAVLGAVYLDGGYEGARAFARATLSEPLARVHRRVPAANPKQALQHLTQARWNEVPLYELIDERGRAHARAFLVAARIDERRFPSAWGRTRKEAERWAAHEALLVLAEEDGG